MLEKLETMNIDYWIFFPATLELPEKITCGSMEA